MYQSYTVSYPNYNVLDYIISLTVRIFWNSILSISTITNIYLVPQRLHHSNYEDILYSEEFVLPIYSLMHF